MSFAGPVDIVTEPAVADDIAAFVREGLTNVVRHAEAATASVAVSASPDDITVAVVDDGHGIGETSRRSGLGNLELRARSRGGTLRVESGADGTRLWLRIPIAEERTDA
ncbi:ATP-binding protein [Leifsonia poae]|uniref:ATP-binding protein n=1 Tax=Leifsonia poae TaxID=110933 RepID=UPI003D69904A